MNVVWVLYGIFILTVIGVAITVHVENLPVYDKRDLTHLIIFAWIVWIFALVSFLIWYNHE